MQLTDVGECKFDKLCTQEFSLLELCDNPKAKRQVRKYARRISDINKREIKDEEVLLIRKGIVPEEASSLKGYYDELEEGEKAIIAYISTGGIDRDNEILEPKGADISDFRKNPVVMWSHKYSDLPVGKATKIWRDEKGLLAKTEFYTDYEFADMVYRMYRDSFLKAMSVGFIPLKFSQPSDEDKEKNDWPKELQRIYQRFLLLEYSCVPVPSNPEALVVAVSKKLFDLDTKVEGSGKPAFEYFGFVKGDLDKILAGDENGDSEIEDEKEAERKEGEKEQEKDEKEFNVTEDENRDEDEEDADEDTLIVEKDDETDLPDKEKELIKDETPPEGFEDIFDFYRKSEEVEFEELGDEDIVFKPFPQEHSCRISPPTNFNRFRRVNCDQKSDGKCIDVIYARDKDTDKWSIQALRYPKDVWGASAAKSHCKGRGGTFEAASSASASAEIESEVLMDNEKEKEKIEDNPDVDERKEGDDVIRNYSTPTTEDNENTTIDILYEIKKELVEIKEGRVLSSKNRKLVKDCMDSMKNSIEALAKLYNATEPQEDAKPGGSSDGGSDIEKEIDFSEWKYLDEPEGDEIEFDTEEVADKIVGALKEARSKDTENLGEKLTSRLKENTIDLAGIVKDNITGRMTRIE